MNLRPYQIEGIQFLTSQKRAGLMDDMGLGKTAQAIHAALSLDRTTRSGQTLVVCPNSVRRTWASQIDLWAPPTVRVDILEGSTSDRLEQLKVSKADFVVINFRSAQLMYLQDPNLLTRRRHCLIIDEAHNVKSSQRTYTHKDKKTKRETTRYTQSGTLYHMSQAVPHVFELTGTPIINRPDDLWSLLNILDPKSFPSFWKFVFKYCDCQYNGFGWEIRGLRPDQGKQLQSVTSLYFLRRLKADVLDLPPLVEEEIWVDLEPYERSLYNRMRDQMLVEIGDRLITAPTSLAQLMRLRQLVIGHELLDDNQASLHGSKFEALRDVIDGAGDQQVVVFSCFAKAIRALSRRLEESGISHVWITGDSSDRERQERLTKFSEGHTQVFLTTIGVGSVGLNELVCASIVVFLDLDWSPEINRQARDRLYRMGQTKKVTCYKILARDSVEEGIVKLLSRKADDAEKSITVKEIL